MLKYLKYTEPKYRTYKMEVKNIYEVVNLEQMSCFVDGCSDTTIIRAIEHIVAKLKLETTPKKLQKQVYKQMGVHTVSQIEGITITPFRDVYSALNKILFNKDYLFD